MKKLTTKLLAFALAIATAVTAVAATPAQASAASSYNCYLMYADSSWDCSNMTSTVANTSVKNAKGKATYTVTLKRKKAKDGNNTTSAVSDACVFCIDIQDIIKDHKASNIKISNVVIKCDGKKVKINQKKLDQGVLESSTDPNKYRLEIYNIYGEGTTSDDPPAKATAFSWKKKISVKFTINIKK